jgi:hypothetical protein
MEILDRLIVTLSDFWNSTITLLLDQQTIDAVLLFGETWGHILIPIAALLTILLYLRSRKRKLAPKMTALTLLKVDRKSLSPSGAMEILRQASMCYFPRTRISALSGSAWFDFLDKQVGRPLFKPSEDIWDSALKSPSKFSDDAELVEQCEEWIKEALPPSRRNIKKFSK